MCGTMDTPLDDRLAQITVPIFQVGCEGRVRSERVCLDDLYRES